MSQLQEPIGCKIIGCGLLADFEIKARNIDSWSTQVCKGHSSEYRIGYVLTPIYHKWVPKVKVREPKPEKVKSNGNQRHVRQQPIAGLGSRQGFARKSPDTERRVVEEKPAAQIAPMPEMRSGRDDDYLIDTYWEDHPNMSRRQAEIAWRKSRRVDTGSS